MENKAKIYPCGAKKNKRKSRNFNKLLASATLVTALGMSFTSCSKFEVVDPLDEYSHINVDPKDVDAVNDGLSVVESSVSDVYRDGKMIAASEITSAYLKKDGVLPTESKVESALGVIQEAYPLASDNQIIALSKMAGAHIEVEGAMPGVKTLRYDMGELNEVSNRWEDCGIVAAAELASTRMKMDESCEFPTETTLRRDISGLRGGLPDDTDYATETDYIVAANIVSGYLEATGKRPRRDDLDDDVDRLNATAPLIGGAGTSRGLSEMANAQIVKDGVMPSIDEMEYEMAVLIDVIGSSSRLGKTVAASNIRAATVLNENSNEKTASYVLEAARMNALQQR